MSKGAAEEMDDDLRPEYDLKSLLEGGVRGKYAARCPAGTNPTNRASNDRPNGPGDTSPGLRPQVDALGFEESSNLRPERPREL